MKNTTITKDTTLTESEEYEQWLSFGSTDNRDQFMDALRTVPGHNDVINVRELRQIVTGLKNNKAVGNDGIPSEVYKFASERRLTMMSIFL